MKKLVSSILIAILALVLPSVSMAKGKKGLSVHGKVTAVVEATDKAPASITVESGGKKAPKTETIAVPAGTSIKDENGGTITVSALNGKNVMVTESSAGTASEITVSAHKGKKK